VQTFLVRVWTPAGGEEAPSDLRGFVEHVGTGRREAFLSDRDAVAFIRDCLGGGPDGEGGQGES
jgi:hypothetical protein